MAKTGSFIKIDHGLKNNPLWLLERPFTKGQAWVDLLLLAQGVSKSREFRGKKSIAKRGYVYTSIRFLSTRWGWSRMKVYRFLEKLMIDEMIVVQGWRIDETTLCTVHRDTSETTNDTANETVISVVNWDLYQYSETTNKTRNGSVFRTENETTKRTHNRKYTKKDTEKEKEIGELRSDSPPGEIPERYKGQFETMDEYLAWRNQ